MNNAGHGRRLAFLLLLAAGVQGTVASRSPLISPDGLQFMRHARWIEQRGLAETLWRTNRHPLYPMLTCAVHRGMSAVGLAKGTTSWDVAGQGTAAAAILLLVVPLYGIGLLLFSPRTAVAGTALFVMLPETAGLGAHAISDSTYLLFFASAFWAGLKFLERPRPLWQLLCGVGSGLAYLARPEGLFLPAVMMLLLLVVALGRREIVPVRRIVASAASLCAGVGLIALPYVAYTGKVTPKSSLTLAIGSGQTQDAAEDVPLPLLFNDGTPAEPVPRRVVLPEPETGTLEFSAKDSSDSRRYWGYGAAITDLAEELARALSIVFAVLALGGALTRTIRSRSAIHAAFAATMIGFFALALVQFAHASGYIATRHTLTMVALAVFWSAAAGLALVERLVHVFADRREPVGTAGLRRTAEPIAFALFLATASLVCLPQSLEPVHESRIANVAAAEWLARNSPPDAVILDTFGWTSSRAGRRAYPYTAARQAFEDSRLAYVVAVRKELDAPSDRGATLRYLLKTAGETVSEFEGRPGKPQENVVVFRWHPERLEQAARLASALRSAGTRQ